MTQAEGQHVALALMAVNSPATGAPAITGAAQEDEVLRVDTSGIADDNGKPAKPGGFKYRWLRVEGGVETEITGETSWAYTVTADDVGKTLKVEVSYTDGDGFEEGPLTSAASDVIEAVDLSAIDFTHYEGFSLHADNSDPWSIWSDGTTLWVGDDAGEKVFAYHLVDNPGTTTVNEYGTRDSSKDIEGVNTEDFIVTGNDNNIWTVEKAPAALMSGAHAYAYNRSDLTRDSGKDFPYRDAELTFGAGQAYFAESDGEYVWIADSGSTAHAYHLTDDANTMDDEYGTQDSSRNIDFSFALFGLHIEGNTIWGIPSTEAGGTIEARRLSDGERVANRDISLNNTGNRLRGVWSNGVTFFVVDNTNDKILTYRHVRHNSPATGAPAITGTAQEGQALGVDTTRPSPTPTACRPAPRTSPTSGCAWTAGRRPTSPARRPRTTTPPSPTWARPSRSGSASRTWTDSTRGRSPARPATRLPATRSGAWSGRPPSRWASRIRGDLVMSTAIALSSKSAR